MIFCSASGAALAAVMTIVDVAIPPAAALAAPIAVVNATVFARDAIAPKDREKCSSPRSPLFF